MDADERLEADTATEMIGGFGSFLVAVAAVLTVATVRKLANVFNYSPAAIDEFERDKDPGYMFAMSLREKGIIQPNDVSTLVDALRHIDLHGIALDVKRLFKEHCKQKKRTEFLNLGKNTGHGSTVDELIESTKRSLLVSPALDIVQTNQSGYIFTEQLKIFVDSIKITYQELYNRVRPIPFIRDRLLSVDKVFIDSGMERLMQKGINQTWQKLESYHCLFHDPRPAPMRCILYGEPGFGKSTLALQLVYDWCNRCSQSPLKNVDILIFLKLRELRGVTSIMKAIKQFLLPRDSIFAQSDITEILYSCKSVVILLDGLDEYANKIGDDDDDVSRIIKGRMFHKFFVIVTTRPSYKPMEMASTTFKVRLTGFGSEAQDNYIRKTLVDNAVTVETIKKTIEENPVVRDLCQVPLFFAMSSYMIYEKAMSMNFDSVTTFFRYTIGSFHEHMKSKLDVKKLRKYEQLEINHETLDKAAFEALTGVTQEIVWTKENLQSLIGNDLYDQYSKIGILVEEEVVFFNEAPGSPTYALTRRITHTRFYHKLFCEWYAAQYLSKHFAQIFTLNLSDTTKQLDPFQLQYVFRFACGINPSAAPPIIDYLQTKEGGDKFAILCILEQTGKVDSILESIQQICCEGVIISSHDSLLLQRSSLQLLEIAAKYEIPIETVQLHNCFQSVEPSTPSIRTTSGLTFTSRIPVKELAIQLFNREITKDEVIAVLKFSSRCPSLRWLVFYGSVPPQSFKVDSTLSTLKSRNVTVEWQMFKNDPWYTLQLVTGRWEHHEDEGEPTLEEFEKMRLRFAQILEIQRDHKHEAEVLFKKETERTRKKLREKAKIRQEEASD